MLIILFNDHLIVSILDLLIDSMGVFLVFIQTARRKSLLLC